MDVSLIMPKKDGTKKVFPVRNKATIVGRRPDCDLCIPLQVVSRRHCQLSQNDGLVVIRDLSSSNGTYLNGKKIDEEILAKPGDTLQIGPLTFMIQIDGRPSDANISAMDTAIIQSSEIPEANGELNQSGTIAG
ncbi:MAG: FHA domain-containing protein [Sedimentisphaerales bacterium]